jgi:hypothetical protein
MGVVTQSCQHYWEAKEDHKFEAILGNFMRLSRKIDEDGSLHRIGDT